MRVPLAASRQTIRYQPTPRYWRNLQVTGDPLPQLYPLDYQKLNVAEILAMVAS